MASEAVCTKNWKHVLGPSWRGWICRTYRLELATERQEAEGRNYCKIGYLRKL